MKKSCFVALGALMSVIGVSHAASMKEACLAFPSTFVWVEKNQDCVPINPCSQPETSNYYKLYCNDDYSNYMIIDAPKGNDYMAESVEYYYDTVAKRPARCEQIGADFVSCFFTDGDFIQFRFSRSGGESAKWANQPDAVTARAVLCEMMGGVVGRGVGDPTWIASICNNLGSEDRCRLWLTEGHYVHYHGWFNETGECKYLE